MPINRPVGSPGYIAILGSGEMADSVAETHRTLMARLSEAPSPVFIDTMAGFELNIDQIDQKAIQGMMSDTEATQSLESLHGLEQQIAHVGVPLSYMEEYYNLRLHLNLVRAHFFRADGANWINHVSRDGAALVSETPSRILYHLFLAASELMRIEAP